MPLAEKRTLGRRIWAWTRALLFAAFVALLSVGVGFVIFAQTVAGQSERAQTVSVETLPEADGVVVWTGPGGGRLEAGADVLLAGRGERLLISGVNGVNSRDDIAELLALPPDLADCCLDLDYAAIDTESNARETWAWVDALGYEHIILVTSAYHMPRAQVALGTRAGRIQVTPYPVGSTDYDHWWRNPEMRERLWREYAKLLVSYFRDPAAPPTRETPTLELEADDAG